MKPLGIITFATGGEMWEAYARNLVRALRQKFPPHESIVFSESPIDGCDVYIPHDGGPWPLCSLMRYHHMLGHLDLLSKYSQLICMDADMMPVSQVEMYEIETHDIVAVQHPSYPDAFERDPKSAACVKGGPYKYYQACIIGGATEPFLRLCQGVRKSIDADLANGIYACNYDESHLNKYLVDHPPAKVLPAAFAYPEGPPYHSVTAIWPLLEGVVPRVKHLEKDIVRTW